MRHESRRPPSTVLRFRRSYFLVSMLPLVCFFLWTLVSATTTRDHLADLISNTTNELNEEAEQSLQELGESIIWEKARSVAKQLTIYAQMHPDASLEEMREDRAFMALAAQTVGQTGYTAVSEAADTYRIRVHPNPELMDFDMRKLSQKMPSWWKIVTAAITGDEAAGYYDWVEPDGSIRKKYMVATPIGVPIDGVVQMVVATTYIDEFSQPVAAMQIRAGEIANHYQAYVSQQWRMFSITFAVIVLSTLAGTLIFGSRSARQFIDPIGDLAKIVGEAEIGRWNAVELEPLIRRDDELGTLAATFQRLSTQTADLFERLEQRVGELKEAQVALRESEEHYRQLYEETKKTEAIYRSLIHSSADALVLTDMKLCVTYLSPTFARIFGWTEEELVGKRIPYVPEAELATTKRILSDVIATGNPVQGYETLRMTKDGGLMDVSVSASRFDDHEGNPVGVLAIMRDLSERKRSEAQMQRIDRLKAIGTLAGGVAHDFNNLMTVIQGNVSLLKNTMEPDGENHEQLVEIEEQIKSASSLTRQLLGYARKGRYEVEVADLNAVVRRIAGTAGRARKDVQIHLDLASDLAPIEADFHQIEQVLLNLDINAFDAMPDGGQLEISTRNCEEPEGLMVLLTVEDSGMGMTQETLDRIFDPFFTTKEFGHGTGLGLASAFGIVEGHGGRIDVSSQPGQGTTFRVYLPASEKAISKRSLEANHVAMGKGTILIVDDQQMVLRVCARLVRSLGYEVLTASEGQQAIEVYRAHAGQIDVVILDMIMPGMNGDVVFDRLKAIDPDVSVLVSSGYSIEGRGNDVIFEGCCGQIQKPYTVEELSASLTTLIKDRDHAC